MFRLIDEVPQLTRRFDSCVEGAFRFGNGTLLSDLDNPRIFNRTTIPEGNRVGLATRFERADHGFATDGGFDPVPLQNESPGSGSINAELPQIAPREGQLAPETQLVGTGVRLGRTILDLFMEDTDSRGRVATTNRFQVGLNPAVFLVPVQVFVLHDNNLPPPAGAMSRDALLALFDRVPEYSLAPAKAYDGSGNLLWTAHAFNRLAVKGGTVRERVDDRYLPDDVFAQCGIQFRLVQAQNLALPSSELRRQNSPDSVSTVVNALSDRIERDPRFVRDILTVFYAPFCSDTNATTGGFAGVPPGQSLLFDRTSCVRYGTRNGILTHEIAHVLLNQSFHTSSGCDPDDERSNIMCKEEGGGVLITKDQCTQMRTILKTSPLGSFFH